VDGSRDAGIVALALFAVLSLTVYFLRAAPVTTTIVEFFFPHA